MGSVTYYVTLAFERDEAGEVDDRRALQGFLRHGAEGLGLQQEAEPHDDQQGAKDARDKG